MDWLNSLDSWLGPMLLLGAYGGNALSSFWSTMLGLRDQRLKQELAEAQMQQEAMQQLGKGIGSMFGSIGQMAQQQGQDKMANQLMNEMMPAPPRAGAVDTPWSDQLASGQPGFYQGGTDELNMRMKMADMRDQQMRAQAYRDQVDMQKSQILIKDATNTWNQTNKKLQNAYKERTAYIKEERLQKDAMAKAEDPIQYQSAADALMGLNQAAVDHGLKGVEPIDPKSIPPFMTKADKAALAQRQKIADQAQQELRAAQNAPLGFWDTARGMVGWTGPQQTIDKDAAIAAAQQKYDMEQKALGAMKGSSPGAQGGVSFYATEAQEAANGGRGPNYPTQASPAATGTTGGSMPTMTSQEASAKFGKPVQPGQIIRDPNGNRILIN